MIVEQFWDLTWWTIYACCCMHLATFRGLHSSHQVAYFQLTDMAANDQIRAIMDLDVILKSYLTLTNCSRAVVSNSRVVAVFGWSPSRVAARGTGASYLADEINLHLNQEEAVVLPGAPRGLSSPYAETSRVLLPTTTTSKTTAATERCRSRWPWVDIAPGPTQIVYPAN